MDSVRNKITGKIGEVIGRTATGVTVRVGSLTTWWGNDALVDIGNHERYEAKEMAVSLSEIDWNRMRERGFTPPSVEEVPTFKYGEKPPPSSKTDVSGFHVGPYVIGDIKSRGNSLDMPGDINPHGQRGSTSTPYEGYVYAHRDISEAEGLLVYLEDGAIYEVCGKGTDRINPGLISAGSLDEVERLFQVDDIVSFQKIAEYVVGRGIVYLNTRPQSLYEEWKSATV